MGYYIEKKDRKAVVDHLNRELGGEAIDLLIVGITNCGHALYVHDQRSNKIYEISGQVCEIVEFAIHDALKYIVEDIKFSAGLIKETTAMKAMLLAQAKKVEVKMPATQHIEDKRSTAIMPASEFVKV